MTESTGNQTIEVLLNRRTIRKFKPDPVDAETTATLEAVAQRAASSSYLNDWTAIRITDQTLKDAIAGIGHQAYIATAPLLYVFIVDEHRNTVIAEHQGVDPKSDEFMLNASNRLVQGHNDTVLALHAMETAAYALGLGCVILGSILNDIDKLIELLHLPPYTYPVLGLAIGTPDQEPALKPRLPHSAQFFENIYPSEDLEFLDPLPTFDSEVHQYYDLRHANRPLEAFSDQIATKSTKSQISKALVPHAQRQGFRFDR